MSERNIQLDQLVYEFHRFMFISSRLVRDYGAGLGLQERDAEAILLIWRAQTEGAPLAPSELAEALHISRAGISYLVDRLVDQGLVSRVPDPHDRRRMQLQLAEHSADVGHNFADPLNRALNRQFESRSGEDLHTFTEMLAELSDALAAPTPNHKEESK